MIEQLVSLMHTKTTVSTEIMIKIAISRAILSILIDSVVCVCTFTLNKMTRNSLVMTKQMKLSNGEICIIVSRTVLIVRMRVLCCYGNFCQLNGRIQHEQPKLFNLTMADNEPIAVE